MADEELHETTADTQEDWQSEAAESTEETTDNDAVAESAEDDDDLDIPMDRVEAVLNATVDKLRTPAVSKRPSRAPSPTRVGSCHCSAH